jgi:hypothetical protein
VGRHELLVVLVALLVMAVLEKFAAARAAQQVGPVVLFLC